MFKSSGGLKRLKDLQQRYSEKDTSLISLTKEHLQLLEQTNLLSLGEKIELLLLSLGDKLSLEFMKQLVIQSLARMNPP